MFDSVKNDKVKIITLIGMAVMIIAVAVKAATSFVPCGNASEQGCIRQGLYRPCTGADRCAWL